MFADASHFSMVGYSVETTDESAMMRSLAPYAERCELQELNASDVLCVIRDPSGGELLLGFSRKDGKPTFETVNPAFDGEGRTEVVITGDVSDPEWKTFERTYQANFAGAQTPLVFEVSDPAQAGLLSSGAKLTVEIAAFSFDIAAYRDAEAFHDAQGKEKIKFAANYFIPTGMFSKALGGRAEDKRPTAYALLAGEIIKAELRENAAGKGRFWWALVRTYDGATLDVVVDPVQLKEPLKPGYVVTGSFWLTARVVER